MDQWNCIEFCVKNEIKRAMKCRLRYLARLLWAEHKFNCGIIVSGRPRRCQWRCPSTSTTDKNIEAVKKIILDNRGIIIREVADDVGTSSGLCHAIFADVLGMKLAAAKIVIKLQSFEQKQSCMNIAQEMLTPFNEDPNLLKKIITGDESWVCGYDIKTKARSSKWKAFCCDWGDKRTVGDTKKRISELFRKLEKMKLTT